MTRSKRRFFCLLLLLALVAGLAPSARAADTAQLKRTLQTASDYMLAAVPKPTVGSVGGEWAVLGLARSGCAVPQTYWNRYYAQVEQTVKQCGGLLHGRKYTEYSRLVLALTAIGADPSDVAGYNLLAPLGEFDKVIQQGVNGPIYALLAMDCGGYKLPQVRQKYVDYVLSHQLPDGGWSLTGTSDPDLTGMALQALAKDRTQPGVAPAIERALAFLSAKQNENGSFDTLESTAQVLVALCELHLPLDYAPLTKGGRSLLDGLLSFRRDDGGFSHDRNGSGNNQMASEQGLYALAAALRAAEGRPSLYDMRDVTLRPSGVKAAGLSGKHADVRPSKVTLPNATFSDVTGHTARSAIEALAQRGILSGKGNGRFDPKATMTRAEFSALVVNALGLSPKATGAFSDVPSSSWYASFVGTAHSYGLVSGVGNGRFAPDALISRQEAAVMVTNAAVLCGLNTSVTGRELAAASRLPVLSDSASWAGNSLAFCCREGILSEEAQTLSPTQSVTRGEVAGMVYQLLVSARLV